MTAAFFGGVYSHSNAAHNVGQSQTYSPPYGLNQVSKLLSMMRVGVLDGGVELVQECRGPPLRKLYIAQSEG